MPWVYLDDAFYDHPKIEAATGQDDVAGWLWVVGLGWTNRNLTSGRIPQSVVTRLTHHPKPAKLANILVDVGLWNAAGDGFFDIHDYHRWNSSAARSSQAKKAAAARWGEKNQPPPDDPPDEPLGTLNGNASAYAGALPEDMQEQSSSNGHASCVPMPGHMPHARRVPTTPRSKSKAAAAASSESDTEAADLITAALNILAGRKLAASTKTIDNVTGWRHGTIAGLRKDHADRLATLPPGFTTAEHIADWLEPAHQPKPKPVDPLEATAAAARAQMARNEHPCAAGCVNGWTLDDNGDPNSRCPHCQTASR